MQQIVFRTKNPQMEITLNDGGTSNITYTSGYNATEPVLTTVNYPTLALFDFDCNSLSTQADNVSCVDMPGQHTIATRVQPRTLAVTLAFDGRSGGSDTDNSMYKLRRLIMRCFPLGVKGEMEYTNSNGTYYINCYATEYPNMERTAGTRVVSTFYLIADYPFWHQDRQGQTHTVSAGDAKAVTVLTEGDMESPIICEIKCTQDMSGTPESLGPYGRYMYIWEPEGHKEDFKEAGAKMSFCKPLTAGQTLIFNTGLNNEVYVRLREADGTERIANDYVDYNNSSLLKNRIGATKWQFHLDGDTGQVEITMHYQNLYWAV